ncbi:MAG: MFS transporter [Dehalococcoidia bacterium]
MATTAVPLRARIPLRLPDAVSALGERDFRIMWAGQAVSLCGTWMQVVAQGLLVLQLWDSAFALGAMNFANALPTLLVMLFGGVLADRGDKRRIMLVTQVVMAALALIVGFLIVADLVQFWLLLVVAGVAGVAIGYDMPAAQAFLPELVPPEKIGQVVALNSSTFHGSRMVGPALAGGIIAASSLSVAYFLNAASFVAVILALMVVRSRPVRQAAGHGMSAIHGLREGLRHARGRPNLQALLLLTGLNTAFLFPSMAILSAFYVKDVLDQGEVVLGLLFMASGIGSVVGALMLIWWTGSRAGRIWAGVIVAPLALCVMALTRQPALAIVAAGVLSLAFSSQLGLVQTIIQESTPAEFRGRVMSLHGIMFNGTMPFAGLASAGLVVALGMPVVMVISAALFGITACWVLRFSAGGIGEVVRLSAVEYEAVAAAR